jgi:hypothetical protein
MCLAGVCMQVHRALYKGRHPVAVKMLTDPGLRSPDEDTLRSFRWVCMCHMAVQGSRHMAAIEASSMQHTFGNIAAATHVVLSVDGSHQAAVGPTSTLSQNKNSMPMVAVCQVTGCVE